MGASCLAAVPRGCGLEARAVRFTRGTGPVPTPGADRGPGRPGHVKPAPDVVGRPGHALLAEPGHGAVQGGHIRQRGVLRSEYASSATSLTAPACLQSGSRNMLRNGGEGPQPAIVQAHRSIPEQGRSEMIGTSLTRLLGPLRRLQQYARLRRRIRTLLGEVGVSQPWSINAFCKDVARYRGRALELVPYSMPGGGPVGIWIALRSVDVIIYDQNTTELHQEQIIAHELGHMLMGHHGTDLAAVKDRPLDPRLARALGLSPTSDADEGASPVKLHRESYTDRQELEAELVASLIWKAAGRRLLPPPRKLSGTPAETVDRLAEGMGKSGHV